MTKISGVSNGTELTVTSGVRYEMEGKDLVWMNQYPFIAVDQRLSDYSSSSKVGRDRRIAALEGLGRGGFFGGGGRSMLNVGLFTVDHIANTAISYTFSIRLLIF